MTHIDTYSHRIPHKLTQLHTNTHILHTFTHKLPHLWVGHKKSHVYLYIYIYTTNSYNSILKDSTPTPNNEHTNIIHTKKNSSIKKQNEIKSNHSDHSFIQNQIQKIKRFN